jgi:hypothetical protein
VIRSIQGPQANGALRGISLTAIAAGVLLACGAAQAEFDTGNPDLNVRWDNTVRLNYASRVENRDNKIGNSALSDEGDYSSTLGDAVAAHRPAVRTGRGLAQAPRGAERRRLVDDAYGTQPDQPNAPFNAIPSYVNKQPARWSSACTTDRLAKWDAAFTG